ncbi:MAG: GIY-YIG nuclease family protein, partial [Deltaproteobacteria bacterium]|nr:GIY-YIG nuclease family protein [Deltaproteobacteria bacterium]
MERPDPRNISSSPGVYCFVDEGSIVVYVGKAKNLRKRILSYFRPDHALPAKTRAMLAHAHSLKTLVTATEKEALLLEASMIKKHRPRYNIVLRDDKDHILFRIDTESPYPRVEIVRRVRPARGRARNLTGTALFGPFSSAGAARETWRAIHAAFPLRRCLDKAFANRARPCLYYHMNQCLGPCALAVDKEAYAAMVRQVLLLLRGESETLLALLRAEMEAASGALNFEYAAVLRDRMRAVSQTVERQAVVLDVNQDMDVLGIAAVGEGLALCILFVRGGVLLDKRGYYWPGLCLDDAPELLESFLVQFYLTGLPVPPKIIAPWLRAAGIDGDDPGAAAASVTGQGTELTSMVEDDDEDGPGEALASALAEIRGGAVYLAVPRGRAEEALVAMA